MPSTGTYYINTLNFSTATAVWINSSLTTKAPDGYYVFNGEYRQQVNGLLQTLTSCNTGYKIRSFNSGQNIQNTPCLGDEQWFSSENYITIQLVGNDGVTPRVNNTGGDIVITLRREESGCYTDIYTRDAIIAPGQSQVVVADLTGVAACPECINTADTIQCYVDITPSYIEPTEFFFPLCPL
jgi:hypothetical protein